MHGDIKPQNVLIFEEKSEKYCAKLIDFGNSARYPDDSHEIEMYGSEAWAAPEYQSGALRNQSEGIEADLFSLGLLYFWLIFQRNIVGNPPAPSKGAEKWIVEMKSDIQRCAEEFLEAESLQIEQKRMLGYIFNSSLSRMPKNRKTEPFENFLRVQDPQW